MWLARFIRRRRSAEDETDEPARFAAPDLTRAPTVTAATRKSAQPAVQSPSAPPKGGAGKGFDPYNSGAFERRHAWEKISRR